MKSEIILISGGAACIPPSFYQEKYGNTVAKHQFWLPNTKRKLR